MPVSGGLRLDEIVARLGGVLAGDGSVVVAQVGSLLSAGERRIAFLANPKYRQQLQKTQAAAVIVPPQFASETSLPRIVHPNAYAYYARVAALLNPPLQACPGVRAGAVVKSELPASASIGENVVIGEGVRIGENVIVHPGCVIGDRVAIGDDSLLYPNVVVYGDCVIGKRAIIHAGAVIGGDGFGFAKDGERWVKIPQIGRVLIGDDVEIGANTSIDRGALDDTVIGNGVKLDNQIQIGHNVIIGDDTAMAGCVGVAGSTRIGRRCTVGGAGMIIGHLQLSDDVHISAGSMVTRNLPTAGQYTSIFPLAAHAQWLHTAAQIKRLARLAERVAELEKKLETMEKTS
ncbi:UDP-3-O-(3-hydroxymyristoyl)glucosamine N-acyltransferase [Candidatus Accumulibacter sp. ACC003]|uniref:UDP-3-O-(3-hydroxymyristoyl)glucosamine N-acyltransferase n=1 Tax=Candidatus Accumulibacter sp. ACC003 TaxID=2823334 RepID=UPI0025C733B7|nr:UDP-3-O-(3-hydroxymyristoyl)glucosamine N-acyltransferase [Candidatus Accumulibacter sp. ACC003]